MNKIFKVIWNHTTQTFVVTSELSKAKGKSSSTDERTNTKNLLALGTLGSVVLGSALIPTIAEAAVAIGSASTAGAYAAAISGDAAVNYNNPGSLSYDNPNRTRTGSDLYSPIDNIGDVEATGIAIGNQSSALAANYQNLASGIAIGDYAKASGPLSTALGHFSIASGTGAMAQGTASRASGFNSLSIMRQSAATSAYAMAIGTASWADGVSSLAVGQSATSKGKQSIAIGSADVAATATTDGRGGTAYASNYSTNHTDSSGDYSIAIGTIAKSGASNSTAIGYNANATGGSSFALGVNSKTEKDNSIAIGNQSKALNADTIAAGRQAIANASSAMAFGLQANSSGVSSIAIGESANVATTGVSAIALGTRANADKQGAVSIGLKSNATADQAIAIGELSKATANDTVAIGSTTNATARDAIAIGTNNNVTACYSVAIGSNNKVVQEETYVLGTNIVSTQANSVILGSLSKDRAATTENSATINGITYENFAGQGRSGNGIVSIGQEGAERQLINVAAGKISETSTDAINGSQLYVVANKLSEGWVIANGTKVGDVKLNNQVNFLAGNANTNVEVKANGTTGIYDVVISALNTASTAAGIEYYSVNSTVAENKDNKGATAANAMAAGPKASATGNESIAIGYNSTASSVSATAMGDSSLASGGLSTAIGTSATSTGLAATSIGVLAKATADGANAMGFEATASNNNTVAVGTSSLASGTESTALGYNSTASAQNTVALGSDSIANATSALAVGVGATATADSAVAIGNDSNAMGDSSVAIGESSNATGTYATAVGDTSNATGDRSVAFGIDSKAINASTAAIGDNATATQDNSVALGSGTTTEAAVNTDSATVNGITYSGFAGNTAHSVVSVGNGNQKRQIQNVAAGRISATSTDAINGSQLYVVANNLTDAIKIANNTANTANNTANAANATANKGWNITTAKVGSGNVVGTLVDNIQLGETVTVEAGDNINITQSANKISIATSATPTFTTVTTQNFNAKPNGNINMGGNVVTNVAAPVNDTDAANKQYVDNGRTKVKSDNNSVKVVYDQASNTYDLAVDVVPTVNLQDGKNTKVNNTGTTYSIDAWNTTAKAGSTEVNVTSEVNSTTNTIDYTIDLSDSAKNNITTANSVANQANSTANTANTTVNKGWNITTSGNATGTEDKNVQMGDKVTIDGGENIQITQEGTKISIATSKTPTFTNVTVGDTKINNDGITINNGPSITNNGIDAADKPITNVANGTNATDAVNVQQLNASKAAVLKGLNTAVTTSTNATTGGTDYTVNAWNTTAKAGSTEVNVTSEVNSTTNTIDYTIDLSDSAKNNITTANSVANQANTTANTALQTVVTQIDGTDVKTITKDSNKANFITGDNIVLTADNEGIKIATSKTPTFTNVTVGDTKIDTDGVTINNGPSMTKDGINAGDKVISNVAAGTKPTDAVNVKQLTDNVTNVTNNINNVSNEVAKGWNITTSASQGSVTGNSTEQINMGELVTIDAGKNINITQTAGKISIATSDKPTFTTAAVGNTSLNGDDIKLGNTTINGNGLTINNGPSITNEGIDAADKPITNVANGVNGTDAVNLNQLNETKAAITTTVTSDDKSITVKENLTNGRIYDISVAQAEVVTNPNGTTANNKAGNTFVTGDNLVNVLNNTSFNVTSGSVDSGKVSGTTAEQVKAGETVTFKAGNNLVLAQDGQNFTYSLSNTLDLTDKGSIKLGNTTITDNNVTVGGVSVTDKGINAANNTISNVKDGEVSATSKDAVNGSQLYTTNQNVTNVTNTVNKGWNITTSASNGSAEGTSLTNVKMGDTVTIDAGKNINITQTAGKISIATSDNPTFSNVTVGDTKINNDGVTINNGPSVTKNGIDAANTTISNVKDGKVEAGSKEAVNGGQLFNATTNLTNAGLNFVGNNASGVIHKNLTDTLSIVGELATDAAASAKNVRVDTENDKLVIKISENPTFTTVTTGNTTLNDKGLTIKDGPSITNNGIDAGNKQITNVAEGKKGTDAVNLDQLNRTTAAAKTELANSNTTTVTREKGADGQDIYKVEVNKGDVTVNNDGTVSTPDSSDSFATVTDVVNALNNVSWTIQGNGVDEDKVTAGNQVNFVNGAGTTAEVSSDGTKTDVTFNVNKSGLTANNGKVTANQSGDAFATAEDVAKAITDSELTSTVVSGNSNLVVTNTTTGNNTEFKVTLSNNLTLTDKGSVKIGNTTLNNDGLTVGNTSVTADGVKVGNVTINNDGIDAGGNKITNVANGTNATDAVNVSQLDAKTAAAKTELANGNTTTVTPKTGDNGQTIYTVEVNKAPVTINSTTGVAETSAAGDKANNSFATVGDMVNVLNNVSWTIQGNGADKDKVTAGNQVNFVNGAGTTAEVNSDGTKTDVTFNVNKSGLTVNKDGNGNVTVTANQSGDTFATAEDVAKAITDSELTSTVVSGNNNLVVTNTTTGNNTEFNVTLSNDLDLTDKGSLTIGNVTVKADGINAGDNKVTGVADGDISPASTQAVNGSQLYAANQNIANYLGGNSTVDDKGNVTAPTYTITKTDGSTATANNVGEAINNLNNEVVKPLTFAGDTGTASERKLGSTVTVKGGVSDEAKLADNNIGVVSDGNGTLTVKLAKDINVDSVNAKQVTANTVKAGDTTIDSDGVKVANGPSVTKSGIDAAGNKITNVKAGEADTDAVNVSQLKAATGNVHNRINKVNKELRAGIAGANAAAGLPQVYVPGKSMVAAAAGTFKGESALAVGYSRSSDNGKVILKLQGNANTRGDLGGSVGVGYQW